MRHFLSSLAGLLAFCLSVGVSAAQDTPRIVAVNYPLQYFAQRLVADAAEVVFPVPAGVDPSFWRPSIADISAAQSADMILLNGAGFATWTAKVSLPRSRIVDTSRGLEDRLIATESITHSHGDGGAHSHTGTASYTWLDPMMALAQAEVIADALKLRGLAEPAQVDGALDALAQDLTAAHAAARDSLSAASETVFIATHPRYQYLARAYGLTVMSLEWEAGAMPNAAELEDLRALVAESGATVLIWEAEPPTQARSMVRDLGLQDLLFPPLAVPPASGSFIKAFEAGVEAMAAAAERAESG